jgi:protein O-GlcNAc transferase
MTNLAEALQLAISHHQAGRLADAEPIYRQILAAQPDNADALQLLGALAYQSGRSDLAVEYIGRAIALSPGNAPWQVNLGVAQKALGRIPEAIASFRTAVQLDREFAEAWHNLGTILLEQNDLVEALECLREAVRLRPDHAIAHNNLGILLGRQGLFAAAVASYRESLRLSPQADTYNNIGVAVKNLGDLDSALRYYQHALQLDPACIEAQNNIGGIHVARQEWDAALHAYQQAIHVVPQHLPSYLNLGYVLRVMGRPNEALVAYQQAVNVRPDSATAWNNMGVIYQELDQLSEAAARYQHALQINPQQVDALINIASVCRIMGLIEPAHEALARVMQISPTPVGRVGRDTLLPVIYDSREDLQQWRARLTANVAQLHADGVRLDPQVDLIVPNFYLSYQGLNDRDLQREMSRLFAPRPQDRLPLHRHADGRIHVGFISRFFCSHTVGKVMRGIIARLSRERFHVTVLSLARRDDEWSLAIREAADEFISLPEDLTSARKAIEGCRIDVLFYADIGMEQMTYSLAHQRLAPVQCVTWGHPDTTGIPTVDYFLSSELLEPENAQEHYSEKLVQLRSLPTCYSRVRFDGPKKPREVFGLAATDHLYLCPQSLFKIHPEFDPLLGEILRRDPQGRVVLFRGSYDPWTDRLAARLQRTLPDVADRIQFLPRQSFADYLNLLLLADVLLDTPHFSGGNTTFDAFGLNLPVVTLPGLLMRGRQTLACYRKMGLLDCVAQTSQDYVDLAVRLAQDADYRAAMRTKIAERSDVLFDDTAAVREIEKFLVQAFEQATRE